MMAKSLNFNPRKLLQQNPQPAGQVRPATMAKMSNSRSPSGRTIQQPISATFAATRSATVNNATTPPASATMPTSQKHHAPSSSCYTGNKMSQKIIQLLKSNDVLRNTPGSAAESTMNSGGGLKMTDIKRVAYRKGCAQSVNLVGGPVLP